MKLMHSSHMRWYMVLTWEIFQLKVISWYYFIYFYSGHDVSKLFQVQWLTLVHQLLQEVKVVGVGYQDVPDDH